MGPVDGWGHGHTLFSEKPAAVLVLTPGVGAGRIAKGFWFTVDCFVLHPDAVPVAVEIVPPQPDDTWGFCPVNVLLQLGLIEGANGLFLAEGGDEQNRPTDWAPLSTPKVPKPLLSPLPKTGHVVALFCCPNALIAALLWSSRFPV